MIDFNGLFDRALQLQGGGWIAGVLLIWFVLKETFSQDQLRGFARLLTPLNNVVKRETKAKAAHVDEFETGRFERLQEDLAAVQAELKTTRAELQRQISDLRGTEREHHGYIIYLTGLIRDLEIWAAKQGVSLPFQLKTFTEWQLMR